MAFLPILLLFMPTLIAIVKGHPRLGKVLLLNLLLGPTGFGWFYVLYLALFPRPQMPQRHSGCIQRPRSARKHHKVDMLEAQYYGRVTGIPWGYFAD